jgi:hypothetical protein
MDRKQEESDNMKYLMLFCLASILVFGTAWSAEKAQSQPRDQAEQSKTVAKNESVVEAATPEAETVSWSVAASGGGQRNLGGIRLGATIGQTVAGRLTLGGSKLTAGFWQNFDYNLSCCLLRGDVNHSGGRDISDLTFLVDYLWAGGPLPFCPDEGDVNGSGGMDISDVTYLVDYLWAGGPLPPDCD